MSFPPPPTHESYVHHFRWDSSVPQSVSIKGSFDNWQSALQLNKHPSGKFSAPIELAFGTKVTYKYVIDGIWRHNPNEPTETDSNGNINNVFQVPHPPSKTIDPAPDSVQPRPNPGTTTMSSDALSEESLKNSTVEDTPKDPKPQIDDMSIAFPSTSTDEVPELIQRPKQPSRNKRTTSLFSSAARFARPSYRATSLIPSAPGTPPEKASPAGASVSNVVSALAGVAATAIPAAIFAVTGKDITRSPTKPTEAESKQGHDSPAVAETGASPQPPDENSQEPSTTDASPTQEDSTQKPIQSTDLVAESSQTLSEVQSTPLPVNQASENPQPKDGALVDAPATHQALPEHSIPEVKPTSPTANIESAQTANTGPSEPLPLTETPAATIVLTPPSAAPILTTSPSASAEPPTLESEQSTKQLEPSIKQPEQSIHHPEQSTEQQNPSSEQRDPSSEQRDPSIEQQDPSSAQQGSSTEQSESSHVQSIPAGTKDAQEETKFSPSNENINAEPPARVSFTEERPNTATKTSVTPKRGSILIPSTPVSPTSGNNENVNAITPITSVAPKNEQIASLGTKSKKSETLRKTSGWRYSVGSIRSRKTSGEIQRPSVTDDHPQESKSNENDGSSPRSKRRSGIFQKIKSALSPNKHHDKSPTRSNNSKKRNSFGRTTTINQD